MSRYNEYIKSSGWMAKAQAAKQRAGQKCQLCGAKRKDVQLDTHHNTYQRLGREKNTDLLVLCEPCHAKHHDKLPKPDGEQLPLDSTNGTVDAHDNTTPSQSLPLTPLKVMQWGKRKQLEPDNATSDAVESVVNAVTLPEWDAMTDDEKVADARWLCAAVEKKMDVQPPHIARKVAERIECGASTYGNYRRGLCVLRSNYKRHGYRYIRDVLSHYLNTGDWKQTELPALTARQVAYNDAYKQKNAADEKRLAEIEDRSKTAYAWVGRVQLTAQRSTAECVRLDKRIDFVDKAVNQRCDHQDELIIALRQRLNGLAEANKHLLEKLAAATEPTPDATPHVELAQWWERWWSR
jgi:hypothetical protein